MCAPEKVATRALPNLRALEALDAGLCHLREGRQATACKLLREACFRAPAWAAAWTHLGLACAQAHNWHGSLSLCLVAIELEGDGAGRRTYETLGLAATMLDDWARARWAWRECGWLIAEGTGPILDDFGLAAACVQRAVGLVEVWCRRIHPVRARVIGVPPPETGRHHGDLVLLGTERLEIRQRQGRAYPLLEELMLLEASDYQTWAVDVHAATDLDLDDLRARCVAVDVHLDDWTATDTAASEAPWKAQRALGMASRAFPPHRVLSAWKLAHPNRTVSALRRVDRTPIPSA